MALFRCKMCGGNLEVKDGQTVVTCDFCGSTQTVPNADSEKKINLFNRANNLRIKNEFDKALVAYQSILSDFPNDAEAHWGICLCKYGIEYVDDPRTGDKVPTCHRTLFDSIFDDVDYKEAIAHADSVAKDVYQAEAKEIDRLQKHIIKVSQKEEPYDVFICYKETDETGKRTPDSVLALDIYEKLTEKEYKVFFARVTLEGMLGQEYEPIIFAALRSSKVMLVVGTKPEFFNAVWVKNEWSRFLSFMKDDKDKYLIPCFKGMDAYDMPEEFLPFQSQDMGKLGYIQDLIRGIDKLFDRNRTKKVLEANGDNQLEDYFTRLDSALQQSQFDKAEWILEEVFALSPNCSKAFLYKILIKRKYTSTNDFFDSREPIDDDEDYIKALEYASQSYKETLISYSNAIQKNLYQEKYNIAVSLMDQKKYEEAIRTFKEVSFFENSKELIDKCYTAIKDGKYKLANENLDKKQFKEAKQLFVELGDYRDSKQLVQDVDNEEVLFTSTQVIKSAINNLNKSRFEEGVKKLNSIANYKNIPDLIKQYEKQFNDRIAIANKKKKTKKIVFISAGGFVALLTVFFILLGVVIVPSNKYNNAMGLIRAGNYDAAQEILDGLNWSNSKAQSTLISARKALDRNDYSRGIEYVCSVGGTVNLDYTCDKGTFSKTHDSIKSKSEFSLPTWTYNGYHITEWNVDKYSIDSSTSNYVADITLKASYDITSYTISLCKATAGTIDETIGYNITKSISIENPSRTGYTFLGWTGGEYTTPTKDLVIPLGTYGDITLVAQWELIDYNITYYLDGGSTTNPATYTIEDNFTLSNATKIGYTFVGWYTSDAYTKEVKTISNQTGDISLYAKFSANTYTYLLDANGGTLENPVKSIKVTYDYMYDSKKDELTITDGEKIPFKTMDRQYYRIVDWCTDSSLFNVFNFNQNVVEDITLYAKWEQSPYDYLCYHKEIEQTYANKDSSESNTFEYVAAASGTISGYLSYSYTLPGYGQYTTTYMDLSIYNVTTGTSYYSGDVRKDRSQSYSGSVNQGDLIKFSITCYSAAANSLYRPKVSISVDSPSMPVPQSTSYAYIPKNVETFEQSVVFDSSVVLPTPVRHGFVFAGWKIDDQVITELNIEHWYIGQSGVLIAVWE